MLPLNVIFDKTGLALAACLWAFLARLGFLREMETCLTELAKFLNSHRKPRSHRHRHQRLVQIALTMSSALNERAGPDVEC